MEYTCNDLQSMIQSAFDKSDKNRDRFLKCEEAYKAKVVDVSSFSRQKRKNNSTKSRLFVPLIKTTTQILHSIFQTSFMSNKCPIIIERVGERENDRQIRNALMSVVKHAWENSSHKSGLSKAVLCAISLPLGIVALFWDSKNSHVKTRFIPITDIAFDPDALDINDIEYVCYRTKVSVREIREGFERGLYQIKKDTSLYLDEKKNNERLIKDEIYIKTASNWQLTTFIDNHIVRDKIQFKDLPFHFGYLIEELPSIEEDERENESGIYGYAVPELLIELQKEYNIKRNQKIDLVEKIIRPTRTVDKNAGAVSIADIENDSPFIRVATEQGKRVQDVVSVDYIPSSYPLSEEIGLLEKEYEIASGINSVMTGQTSPSDRRAMGALQIVNASSSMRIESMMQTLVDTMLNSYAQHFAKLVYNNTSDEEFVKITEDLQIINVIGKVGNRIPLDFNARINFGTIISEEVKFSKLSQLLQILMQSGVTNTVIVEKLLQDIMILIQGENAAIEEIRTAPMDMPSEPALDEMERESLLGGGL